MSNLEKYLKLIGKQEEVKEEEITVIRNPNLEKICRSYEKWLGSLRIERQDWKDLYDHALKTYSKKEYTSKDIEDFSVELLKYKGKKHFEKTGLFLSALINSSKDKEFTILTEHLAQRINFIGYCNKKIVNVKGNVGNYVGLSNKGTISVKGKIKLLSKDANYYQTSKIYEKGKLIVSNRRIMK